VLVQVKGANNSVMHGANITLSGHIDGNNNTILIGDARVQSEVRIYVNGDDNHIRIDDFYQIKGLSIRCGNHVKAHHTSVKIGTHFSIEPDCVFLLYNTNNRITIGDDCLFSSGITIRCGESPHLIFDLETGAYLDVSDGVFIGDHVWIGERVYVNKRTTIPSDCIVAACSVVTKRFGDPHAVIGGNPADIVKRNIHWVRNPDFLQKNSMFAQQYAQHHQRIADQIGVRKAGQPGDMTEARGSP
jgi:acetyltransferase-like isoleucine patch superfamily enzyme